MVRSRIWKLLLSLLLFGGTLELGIRLFGLAPPLRQIEVGKENSPYVFSDSPILGYEIRPGIDRAGEEVADLMFRKTNADGFRDREWTRQPEKERIILLGDSVVEALGIRSHEDMPSRQLEQQLELRGLKREVLNFGVGGYATLPEVELLRLKGIDLSPSLVVLLFVGNDFLTFNERFSQAADGSIRRAGRVEKTLLEGSHAFRLARLTRRKTPSLRPETRAVAHQEVLGRNQVVEGLRMLKKLSLTHDFDVLVAAWPAFGEKTFNNGALLPDGEEPQIRALCEGTGLAFVRLDGRLAAKIEKEGRPSNLKATYTVGDGMHCNEAGATLLGTVLADIILDRPAEGFSTALTADDSVLKDLEEWLWVPEADPLASTVLMHGGRLFNEKRYEEVLQLLGPALRDRPDHTRLARVAIMSLLELDRLEEAIVLAKMTLNEQEVRDPHLETILSELMLKRHRLK